MNGNLSPAQGGRRRLILPHPIAELGREHPELERDMIAQLGPDCVFMMGDNPVLPKMPDKPQLMDFFNLRFTAFTRDHLLQSAMLALKSGLEEKVVLACLLHDIANGALIRTDHGYWGAPLPPGAALLPGRVGRIPISASLPRILRTRIPAVGVCTAGVRGGQEPSLVHDGAIDHAERCLCV